MRTQCYAAIALVALGCATAPNVDGSEYDPTAGSQDQATTPPPPGTSHGDNGRPQAPPPTTPPSDAGPPPAFDAGGDAASDTSIASLFPAVVGHSWTFTVASNFSQCAGERTGSVLGTQNVNGRNAFIISSYCAGQSNAAVAVSDKSADVDVQGRYIPQLAEPVAEGAQFQGLSGTTTWHKMGAVTVPAGTFQNCWRTTSGATYVDYCPGAGTVHIHEDHGYGVIDAQLKSKNF
jgi:hypothetical protein